MLQRFLDEGLAQTSYLIACPRTRQAAVVDPRRDADVYVEAARRQGLHLVWAIETHIHADFVSGARELIAAGATTVAGPGAALAFQHHEAHHGENLPLGDVAIELLHTPGHTPEHISLVVRDPGSPARVFTGDTLFVGAVGRPDLLGDELTRRLAGELYDSLTGSLLSLADEVEVYPGHGAGSLCGAGIGTAPFTTIGQERSFNPMLQHRSKEAFVSAVLADLPETPSYFARMKRVNHDGPPLLELIREVSAPAPMTPEAAADAVRHGAYLLDLRPNEAFASAHPAGALNIGYGSKIGYWAGWVVPAGVPIVLLLDGGPAEATEARRQLLRVGLDGLLGFVDGGFGRWRAAGLPVARVHQISGAEFLARLDRVAIIDVRTRKEFAEDHVHGAMSIPTGELVARADEIPRDRPLVVLCEAGYRSSLAASLLESTGFTDVTNVVGGMTAVRTAQQVS